MVYVVLKSFYPANKADDVGKIYMEVAKKYPPDESVAETVVGGAGRSSEKGYEGMSIFKLKEGQFDKLAKNIMGAMSMYNNIEGFGWTVELWATPEEIMAVG